MRRLAAILLASGMVAGGAQGAEPLDGQALFKQKCTACHTAGKVLTGVRKIELPQRDSRLEQFLATHNAPDPAQRAAIVSYLVVEAAK